MMSLVSFPFALPDVFGIGTMGDMALKGTLLLAAAGLASLALRRAPAAARHLAWALAFAGMLALPILALALPAWRIPILPAGPQPADAPAPAPPASTEAARAVQPEARQISTRTPVSRPAVRPGPARALPSPASRDRAWMGWIAWVAVLAWIVGATVVLARLAFSVARVRREGHAARRITSGPAVEVRDELVWRLAIDRPVTLLEGEAGTMPLTWGIRRSRVLLPAGTEAWPADRLRAVLVHELAHVRRRDCAWQLVAEAACALHWFNPLAWAAARRLRLESEHACDDQVLLAGSAGADYASHLLDVARTLRPPRPAVLAAVPMARPSQLRTRLQAVLSADRPRGTVPRHAALPALLAAGGLVAIIAALTPSRAGAAEYAVTPGRCPAPRDASHTSDLDFGRAWHTTWNNGQGCGGSARIEGDVRFTPDLASVASISRGGLFALELRDGGRRTRVEIRLGSGGLLRTFRRGGRVVPWGPEAERWLAAALPELLRYTSYAAEQRTGQILADGDPEAVADSMRRLSSDETRAQYLAALSGPGADPAAAVRALRMIAETADEADRAELLVTAAEGLPADPAVHAAYLRAAREVRREADLRRVLAAFAARGGLSQRSWLELFRLATQVSGEAELEVLLGQLAPTLPADARVQSAYLDAAGRIRDDADRRRALAAQVQTERLDVEMQTRVLREAQGLEADQLQVLLEQSAPHLSGDAGVSAAYRETALRLGDARVRARALRAYAGTAAEGARERVEELRDAPTDADTIPVDRTDRADATTSLIYRNDSGPDRSERMLLARDVMLTEDRTGLERISLDDGYLILRENLPDGTVRRVQIRPGRGDVLQYTWHGDFTGVDREAWARGMIAYFVRLTTPGQRRW